MVVATTSPIAKPPAIPSYRTRPVSQAVPKARSPTTIGTARPSAYHGRVRSPPNRKETSEKPSLRTRRAMTEATAGLHMSGMNMRSISGFRIQIASRVPESTTTRAKNTASPRCASVLMSAVGAASASAMLYAPFLSGAGPVCPGPSCPSPRPLCAPACRSYLGVVFFRTDSLFENAFATARSGLPSR